MAKKKKATKRSVKSAGKPKARAKTVEVKVIKKVLGKAPEEYSFVLNDGRKLRSLFDLIHALEGMTEDVFRQHVNDFRNDFSNWVHDVFEEPELAEELRNINGKIDAEIVLLRKMVNELRKK